MIRILPVGFFLCSFLTLFNPAEAQVVPSIPQADTSMTGPDRDAAEAIKKPDQFGKNIADSIQTFAIRTGSVSYYSVCPGSRIVVPFTPQGPFNDDNLFSVQLVDVRGNAVSISEGIKKGPITAIIPADKRGGHLYRLRVVSTSPAVVGSEVSLRLLPTPTAKLESADGSTSSRIMPGQDAQLRVVFTGSGPWSFQLSDSTMITETVTNPYYLSTKLEKITTYKLLGVANACGSGTVDGSVIVNVDANPEPRLALKDPDKGYRVCTNTPFQVNFSATGAYKAGNNFLVQISDSKGAFKNITSGDTTAPIMARVPPGTAMGDYTLRIISTSPRLVSDSTRITIAAPTQTVLRRDSVKLKEGGSADLSLQFQGGGPWFVLLSDGTYENNILTSPYNIKVSPYNTTNYTITSAGGLCGVGTFSGNAYVSVDVPPSDIAIGNPSQTLICSGGEISLPFTTTGRFYAANKFIVQVSDSTGRYVDMPTTGKESPLKAKITPPTMRDTVATYNLRIVATAPGVASGAREIQIVAPDMAVGEVSGRGAITPGNSTRIRLKFKNGLPPWSFTLSDGSSVSGTFLNPYLISVSPKTTTDFTISSLKNACGTGTSSGSARVVVDN